MLRTTKPLIPFNPDISSRAPDLTCEQTTALVLKAIIKASINRLTGEWILNIILKRCIRAYFGLHPQRQRVPIAATTKEEFGRPRVRLPRGPVVAGSTPETRLPSTARQTEHRLRLRQRQVPSDAVARHTAVHRWTRYVPNIGEGRRGCGTSLGCLISCRNRAFSSITDLWCCNEQNTRSAERSTASWMIPSNRLVNEATEAREYWDVARERHQNADVSLVRLHGRLR